MNTEPSDCGSEMGNLIDRLVCSEIDDAARGRLIAWLEAEPTRWRLCGLAFLEAQMWQEAFREDVSVAPSFQPANVVEGLTGTFQNLPQFRLRVSRDQNEADPQLAELTNDQRSRRTWPTMRGFSAVAAAVLVAFSLGLSVGSLSPWKRMSAPQALPVAGQLGKSITEDESGQLTVNAVNNDSVVAKDDDSTRVRFAHGDSTSSPVQTFAVLKVATEDAGTREIHLPVLEGPASNERWLRPDPEALPEYVQRQLKRRGYQLQQRRRFLEVQLEDGRPAVIPVDQYQVKFVGSQSS